MKWNHTISIGQAIWIFENDIDSIKLSEYSDIKLCSKDKFIVVPFIVLYKNEILLEPSTHSLIRLSNNIAESVFKWRKEYAQ